MMWKCPMCELTTINTYDLKEHMMTHVVKPPKPAYDYKLYTCAKCNFKTRIKPHLLKHNNTKKHIKNHTNVAE